MSNILDKYKDAGVLTFTVKDGQAIADNPYMTSETWHKAFRRLPPLPTSGIPDGPVKIEDMEEQMQFWNIDTNTWDKCEKAITPATFEILKKHEPEGFHIALTPKALRKGEEEKPGNKVDYLAELSGKLLDFASKSNLKHPELLEAFHKQYPEYTHYSQPWRMEQTAYGVHRSTQSDLYSDKASKTEQTAEGIESIKDRVAVEAGYANWIDFYRDCQLCSARMESRMDVVAKRYAESQLAQYKKQINLKALLHELYLECEHGDEDHRQWLKDKFNDFLIKNEKV